MPASPTVYLAGPDVFRPDADACFERMASYCARRGLRGLRPSDGGGPDDAALTGRRLAQRIYDGNVALIRRCDAVVANLSPFRGRVEPDSGTVFELGMAVALGKPVAGYLPGASTSYAERVASCMPTRRGPDGLLRDAEHGLLVEGFGEPMNLMLSRSTRLFESFEAAIDHLAKVLAGPIPGSRVDG